MERIDKLLSSTGRWSRREVKDLMKQGRVRLDGRPVSRPEEKADPASACLTVDGDRVDCSPYVYIMLHKPAGLLSATEDRDQPTVLDLFPPELRRRGLFPVGRLDRDTPGLLLLTDDGALTHQLLHPSHEVDKEYLVWVTGNVQKALPILSAPVVDGGETLTADRVERTGENTITVVIHQGKNRQVRRMGAAAGLKVERLRRVREGKVLLGGLRPGNWRSLTPEEIAFLQD